MLKGAHRGWNEAKGGGGRVKKKRKKIPLEKR